MGSGVSPSRTSLWVPMEFWGCRSEALRGCRGDWTCLLANGMARRLLVARASSVCKVHERLPAVHGVHVLKNLQGAFLSAQNGAFFNRSPDTKQGLRKRSLQGFVAHSPNPTSAKQSHRVHE